VDRSWVPVATPAPARTVTVASSWVMNAVGFTTWVRKVVRSSPVRASSPYSISDATAPYAV
jgi:hypothetical protein